VRVDHNHSIDDKTFILLVGAMNTVVVRGPADQDPDRTGRITARIVTAGHCRAIVRAMKGDRVEAVVDTGQGTQTFEIAATRAGRRLEVTSSRGIVEVREVTRGGTTVRTARFMATRLVALVEHPAAADQGRVEVETSHRLQPRRSG
jgi:hypothetical protein